MGLIHVAMQESLHCFTSLTLIFIDEPHVTFSLDGPDLSKGEINKGICIEIYKVYLWST